MNIQTTTHRATRRLIAGAAHLAALSAVAGVFVATPLMAQAETAPELTAQGGSLKFQMVRSGAAVSTNCLPKAKGVVKVIPGENAETMIVKLSGMRPNTEFDFFVTQVPNPPFGMSWYQGDITTDAWGEAKAKFVGRFNEETFVIAPGAAVAPVVHEGDAATNPPTNGPIHTFHLGLWFNSPADAAAEGCPGITTPFNGEHNAGVQILNTSNFADTDGPLGRLLP